MRLAPVGKYVDEFERGVPAFTGTRGGNCP